MSISETAQMAVSQNGSELLSSADLSLSQSISASASDLKRPSSAASDNQESHVLSRTKDAKVHYGKAARAFLQKDYLTALIHSQKSVNILATNSDLGSSLSASSSWPEHHADLDRLIEKVAILRLTVLTHVYTDAKIKQEMLDHMSKTTESGVDNISLLLSKQPTSLISHLWFEVLRLCSQTTGESDAPALDPTSETIHLAVELPASVISSAVLAALRLDSLDRTAKKGSQAARQIAEWYLASYSSIFHARPPTEKALAAYEKIVNLYALHVLATRLGEWEYAREFVGYASLPESSRFGLLEQINDAQAHLLSRPEREQEAAAAAQQAYQAEKVKRAAEEKAAKVDGTKSADVSKSSSSFLAPNKGENGAISPELTRRKSQEKTGETPPSSGSDSGRSAAPRSQSPAYFAPRSGGTTSSTATSPALSPGFARSATGSRQNSASSPTDADKGERKSSKRLPRSHSDQDGNESSTSAHDKVGSRNSSGKDDASYAATRAHLSRYVKKEHAGKGRSEDRAASNSSAAAASTSTIFSTLRAAFDLRRSQSRNYLMSAIVMLFFFYRVARRPSQDQSAKARQPRVRGSAARSAAARNARSKLVARSSGEGGVLGIGWILLMWRKVMDTIKM